MLILNRDLEFLKMLWLTYFKTSYVDIKQHSRFLCHNHQRYFKTSYVDIKLIDFIGGFFQAILFQNIIC